MEAYGEELTGMLIHHKIHIPSPYMYILSADREYGVSSPTCCLSIPRVILHFYSVNHLHNYNTCIHVLYALIVVDVRCNVILRCIYVHVNVIPKKSLFVSVVRC